MIREQGLAYCGLACCICEQNETCAGCRSDACEGRGWCQNRSCCTEKGLSGCWACDDFPCGKGLLAKTRARAFARFALEYGEGALLDALERNEKAGMVYHYEGQLVGDYDTADTENGIIGLILHGK